MCVLFIISIGYIGCLYDVSSALSSGLDSTFLNTVTNVMPLFIGLLDAAAFFYSNPAARNFMLTSLFTANQPLDMLLPTGSSVSHPADDDDDGEGQLASSFLISSGSIALRDTGGRGGGSDLSKSLIDD